MGHHWSKIHGTTARPARLAVPCQAQRWGPGSSLFQVGAAVRPAPRQRIEVAEVEAQSTAERQQRPPPRLRAPPEPQPLPLSNVPCSNTSTWEERICRFAFVLQDGVYTNLALLVEPGRSLRKRAVEQTVRETLQAGCKLLAASIPLFVRKRLGRLDEQVDTTTAPFASESDAVLAKYADVWSRVVLCLVRTHEQCESEEQARAGGVLPAWRALKSLDAETLVSIVKLSSNDAASRETAVLDVSSWCIKQPLRDNEQSSVIIVAFASLCIGKSKNWLKPEEVAPIISALLYCSRLFSLLSQMSHWKLWDPATLALTALHDDASVKARCWEAFEDRQDTTLSSSSDTAFSRLVVIGEWRPHSTAAAAPAQQVADVEMSDDDDIIILDRAPTPIARRATASASSSAAATSGAIALGSSEPEPIAPPSSSRTDEESAAATAASLIVQGTNFLPAASEVPALPPTRSIPAAASTDQISVINGGSVSLSPRAQSPFAEPEAEVQLELEADQEGFMRNPTPTLSTSRQQQFLMSPLALIQQQQASSSSSRFPLDVAPSQSQSTPATTAASVQLGFDIQPSPEPRQHAEVQASEIMDAKRWLRRSTLGSAQPETQGPQLACSTSSRTLDHDMCSSATVATAGSSAGM